MGGKQTKEQEIAELKDKLASYDKAAEMWRDRWDQTNKELVNKKLQLDSAMKSNACLQDAMEGLLKALGALKNRIGIL